MRDQKRMEGTKTQFQDYAYNTKFKNAVSSWASNSVFAQADNAKTYLQLLEEIEKDTNTSERCPRQTDLVKLEQKLEVEFFKTVKLVFCTCSMSAHPTLMDHFKADVVIIEEAGQGLVGDIAIPLAVNRETLQVVQLTGDHKQLRPVVVTERQNEACNAIRESIFAQYFDHDLFQVFGYRQLKEQFRMHPDISDWPNKTFYGGKLRNNLVTGNREPELQVTMDAFMKHYFPTWNNSHRICIDVSGENTQSEQWHSSSSVVNYAEAFFVDRLVDNLLLFEPPAGGRKVQTEDLYLISPYAGQITLLKRLGDKDCGTVKASTTNGTQGGEGLISIVSLVQNQGEDRAGALGYIWQPHQLNVECTRGMLYEFIVGNFHTWCSSIRRAEDELMVSRKKRTFVSLCEDLMESGSIVRSEDMSTVEENGTVLGSFFTDLPNQKYVAGHNRKRPMLGVPGGAYQRSAFGTLFQGGKRRKY